ncbi:MAG TPA: hypothetical protein VH475_26830 [Tepidisphaeraceae bacterium]|jgi:hypothetical protein
MESLPPVISHSWFALLIAWLVLLTGAAATGASEIVIDAAKEEMPALRPLHGVNGGPLEDQGLIDLSTYFREMRVPLVRLHDCHWPNPDVVDIHAIFPNPDADPARPESYDFVRTDAYVKSILDTGAKIVYRLGESIEHGPDKRRSRPPADPDRWAQVCTGIIRHYNRGWAGGFKYGIDQWEIWNEPDNRPNCWSGSDDEYLRLYVAAARAIKHEFPDVQVGGPAIGNAGTIDHGQFKPTPFSIAFLERCRRGRAPLDFFSWHWYGNWADALVIRARGVRRMLDDHAFAKTQSHLNEWNYLPDDDWRPMLANGQGAARQRFYDRIGGVEGAVFSAGVLMHLQDLPVDAATYFSGNTQGFGLFSPAGVPKKTFYAFKAFAGLAEAPVRLAATCDDPSLTCCAARSRDGTEVRLLIACSRADDRPVQLTIRNVNWPAGASYAQSSVDSTHDLAQTRSGRLSPGQLSLPVEFKGPGVILITFVPGATK